MRKYMAVVLAGFGLVSGCASQRDVKFGEYSMNRGSYDSLARFAHESRQTLNYDEMIHFCEDSDENIDLFLSDFEAREGLRNLVVKISN